MPDTPELLDALDLAIARSEGFVSEGLTAVMVELAQRSRVRAGFVGEVLVVALAGGTGSGKSSLVNALAGELIVETGVVRPTTQRATAVVPPHSRVDLAPLLEALTVERVVVNPGGGDTVFIDLPDFDSIEAAHRHVVDAVLPRVDAVVWVLDPEKYADPVLHERFLVDLVPYESQFLFALNQADRLGERIGEATAALEELLVRDGFDAAWLCTTIAAAPSGTNDVSALAAAIDDRLDAKRTAVAKLALDALRVADDGWRACTSADLRNAGDATRDHVALAAATFVSLGVTAYGLKHEMVEDERS